MATARRSSAIQRPRRQPRGAPAAGPMRPAGRARTARPLFGSRRSARPPVPVTGCGRPPPCQRARSSIPLGRSPPPPPAVTGALGSPPFSGRRGDGRTRLGGWAGGLLLVLGQRRLPYSKRRRPWWHRRRRRTETGTRGVGVTCGQTRARALAAAAPVGAARDWGNSVRDRETGASGEGEHPPSWRRRARSTRTDHPAAAPPKGLAVPPPRGPTPRQSANPPCTQLRRRPPPRPCRHHRGRRRVRGGDHGHSRRDARRCGIRVGIVPASPASATDLRVSACSATRALPNPAGLPSLFQTPSPVAP